jgi:hypothetical protein
MGYGLWLFDDLPVTDGPGHDGQSADGDSSATNESEVPVEYQGPGSWCMFRRSRTLVLKCGHAYDP